MMMVFRRRLFLSSLVIFFMWTGQALAAPQDLVITEVMYDAKGVDDKHEWVELHNQGTSSITIKTGTAGNDSWRFSDGSNHTFILYPVSQSQVIIPSGAYVILADDPATFLLDYPGFSDKLFKVSMSLGNDGDTLKLSADKGASFFNEVTYTKILGAAGNGRTLERDGLLFRESYVNGGTPGLASSAPLPPPIYSDAVVVNEVYSNPKTGEQEFIELYNAGSTGVDLSGWQIDDIVEGGSKPYIMPASTLIAPGNYLIFYDKVALNNDGDWARLIAPDGAVKSQMSYASSTKGRSLIRQVDNVFIQTRFVTPGAINQPTPVVQSNDIIINEIFPDPNSGSDDEFIELRNVGQTSIDLTDWLLDDSDGGSSPYTIADNTIIPAGGYWIFYASTTSIGLNNDGDHARIFWANGTKVGDIVYSESQVEGSYSLRDDGSFGWTSIITPGSPNQFPKPVISQLVTSNQQAEPPLPQSPIETVKIEESARSVKSATDQSDDKSELSKFQLPPLPLSSEHHIEPQTLASNQKDSTMVPQGIVGGSMAMLGLGLRRWYIRRLTKNKLKR